MYLDFDGVLHPDAAYLDRYGRIYLKSQGTLFGYAQHLSEILDPYPDVKIVLSTSWVRVKGFGKTLKKMPSDLQSRVIGATWHSGYKQDTEMLEWWEYSSRFQQIQRDVLRRKPDAWLALDDDTQGWPLDQQHNLVICESDFGLSSIGTRDLLQAKMKRIFGTPSQISNRLNSFKSIS